MNQKFLYLTLDLASISFPLIFSFWKKAPFYKEWRWALPGIIVTAIFFIIWDELFTQLGVWGFNPRYLTGYNLGSLPIEEVLFFFCIPYACLFTYFAINKLARDRWSGIQELISKFIIVASMGIGMYYMEKAYTSSTFILLAVFLAAQFFKLRPNYMGRFYFAYLFILIPFFIVNGILTGSFIDEEVVWYDNSENLGLRIGTIPVEDIFYGMLMIVMSVTIYEYLKAHRKRNVKKKSHL